MSVTLSQGKINNSRIAKIKNTFVEHARYELTSRQQKVLLYLIANLDNRLDDFFYQDIAIKELEAFLKTDTQSKWGDAYSEISNFILEMQDLKFVFKSGEDYKGKKLPGTITCFDGIKPQKNEAGESIVRFMFGQSMKEFLIHLTQDFVQIDTRDVRRMKNRYAIRLFQMLKAEFNKRMKYKDLITKTITLEELRFILALEDKYETFKSLNQFVLKPAVKEINKLTPIEIKLNYKRKGRSVNAIEFYIMANGKYTHQSQGVLPFPLDKKAKKKAKKKAPFDMDQFIKRYNRIYLDLIKDIKKQLPQISMDNQAWQHALRNACETWYRKNV